MKTALDLTDDELRAALTPPNVRALRTLQAALGAGVVLFGAFVAFQASGAAVPEEARVASARSAVDALTAAHAVLFVALHAAGVAITAATFSRSALERIGHAIAAERVVGLLRANRILRLALSEGTALLGLTIVFIAVQDGVLAREPAYGLNALSALVHLGVVVLTFPSEDSLVAAFRERVGVP